MWLRIGVNSGAPSACYCRGDLSRFLLASFLLLALPAAPLHAETKPDGQSTFDSSCAGCHGSAGMGGRGPSLKGQLRVGNDAADIKKTILNGIPGTGMPKFDFEDDELQALVAYVRSLHSVNSSAPHPGDKQEGKLIYDRSGCSGCHKIGNDGNAFGPNLTRIGAERSYEYLKTSILNPSADVPETYQTLIVRTQDGKEYRGLRVNEDSFTLQLRLPDQTFRSFDKRDIVQEKAETESAMPPYQFNERDLANLLAYLSDLRQEPGVNSESDEERKQR
jgi:putative heme-binding domain-containing protein